MIKKHMILPAALLGFFCFCLVLSSPSISKASPAEEAKALLESRIDKVINLLKEPAFTNPALRSGQIDKINGEILSIFDFEEFSERTIGKRWNSFTDTQKKDFMDAFDNLLTATYLEKMDTYDGQSVSYTGTRTSKDNKKVEIQTNVNSANKAIPVFYQMIAKNNTWVVYDVRIEGMSLVENYRSQFSEIFKSGGNIEDLIVRVRTLAKEMQSKNRSQQK